MRLPEFTHSRALPALPPDEVNMETKIIVRFFVLNCSGNQIIVRFFVIVVINCHNTSGGPGTSSV